MTYQALSHLCHYVATHGGYVLPFARLTAAQNPSLTWETFRNALNANGGCYGYAEEAVKRSFDLGRT